MATILLKLRKLNLLLDQGYFSILRKLHPYFYQPLYQVTVLNLTELIMELCFLLRSNFPFFCYNITSSEGESERYSSPTVTSSET